VSAGTEVLRRLLPPSQDLDEAVKRFQSSNGLTVDGIVGPVTWREILEQKARP
jgi:peptidoglycan hydrolase-like protein with peptidoglycan-binding domain